MSDYIKREDAAKILLQRREFAENQEWTQEVDLMELLCERLEEVPAADVREVVRGEWFISFGKKDGKPVGTICPVCGFAWSEAIDAVKLEPVLSLIKTPFCPNCGADMRTEGT